MPTSRRPSVFPIATLLPALLLSACGSPPAEPERPTRAAFVAARGDATRPQLERAIAAIGQAVGAPAWTLDEMDAHLDDPAPAGDIVLRQALGGTGANARVLLLEHVFASGTTLDRLGLRHLQREVESQRIPKVADVVKPDAGAVLVLDKAGMLLLARPLSGPETQMAGSEIEDMEELAGLKYLVVVRTTGYVAPEALGDGKYLQGFYAGQAMVFRLADGSLIGQVATVAGNNLGKVVGVSYDLSTAVLDDLRCRFEGTTPPCP